MYIYQKETWGLDIRVTSQPSKPKATASSVKRSAYMWADSFVESSLFAISVPSSHSVMKVPNTLFPIKTPYNQPYISNSTHMWSKILGTIKSKERRKDGIKKDILTVDAGV